MTEKGRSELDDEERRFWEQRGPVILFSSFIALLCLYVVAIIGQDEARADNQNWQFLSSILLSVSSAIIVVLIVDFLFLRRTMRYLRRYIGDEFADKLKESGLSMHGIISVHDGMPRDKFRSYIRESSELLVLQTFIANMPNIEIDLRLFFENGGKARVLLLDPRSDLVAIRSRELTAVSERKFRAEIISNIMLLRHLGDENCEIHLYEASPAASIYMADKHLLVGHFLFKKHAVQGPIIEARDGHYKKEMIEHFENLWDNSTKLDNKLFE
ncbi:MAG: hypothetical protein AAFX09_08260 [Pseudomonadota bacterium]